jgi:hypothetical protein
MQKRGDIILVGMIIIVTVFCAGGFYLWQNAHKQNHLIAVIIQNDKIVAQIDLNNVKKPRNITLQGEYHNHIRVEKGRIRYEDSDCPNRICVQTGWLTKYGDIATCLPNRTLIEIKVGK